MPRNSQEAVEDRERERVLRRGRVLAGRCTTPIPPCPLKGKNHHHVCQMSAGSSHIQDGTDIAGASASSSSRHCPAREASQPPTSPSRPIVAPRRQPRALRGVRHQEYSFADGYTSGCEGASRRAPGEHNPHPLRPMGSRLSSAHLAPCPPPELHVALLRETRLCQTAISRADPRAAPELPFFPLVPLLHCSTHPARPAGVGGRRKLTYVELRILKIRN
jgi:hypothetical protein